MTLRLLTSILAVSCAVVVCVSAASAQEPNAVLAPPHLSLIEGTADIEREGQVASAELGQILAAGDRLRTGAGRVEILFGDGSALHVDERTTLDLLDEGLVRLLAGRVFLHVTASADERFEYRIDTPAATVSTEVPGEYRVAVTGDARPVMELAVARGLASVTTAQDALALRAGELVRVRANERPGFPVAFNAADWNAFDRWSYEQRHGRVDPYASGLPVALTPYTRTLGQRGTWSHDPTHGAIWYPRVAVGWRPFYHGRWTSISPYGWTWIGLDPWAWPTHYYGSWGVTHAGVWFWIPGRHWRAAPVHWTITAGYIGWAPWGYGSIAHFGFTVVPRRVFAVNIVVPRHAVKVHTITPVIRTTFVAQPPPQPRGVAVPRAFAAERRVAMPRTVSVARDGTRPRGATTESAASRTAVPRNQARGRATNPARAAMLTSGGSTRNPGATAVLRGSSAPATATRRALDRAPGGQPSTAAPTASEPSPAFRRAPSEIAGGGSNGLALRTPTPRSVEPSRAGTSAQPRVMERPERGSAVPRAADRGPATPRAPAAVPQGARQAVPRSEAPAGRSSGGQGSSRSRGRR